MSDLLITKPARLARNKDKTWSVRHDQLTGKAFVCLYRVSTHGQKQSGLGLEVQLHGCREHVAQNGYVIAEYEEIVSGRSSERPVFNQAVLMCRKHRAALLVYKLDRVSRTLQAVPDLMRQEVEVVVSTMPSATPLILCMLSALATDEAERISYRTKEALAARRRRLGPPSVKPVMPSSVSEAGRLTKLHRNLQKTRNFRDAARRYAERGLSLRQNADAVMLEYPLSGRVTAMKVWRWLHDDRDAQDYETAMWEAKKKASLDMKQVVQNSSRQ